MAALASQKTFTFMKDATIFEDQKQTNHGPAQTLYVKAGSQLCKAGIRYRNPYQTRHTFATRHINQVQTSSGLQARWVIRGQRCYSDIMVLILRSMTAILK
jgi:integrase